MNPSLIARLQLLRVLVVDDEPYMRKVIKTILAAIGVPKTMEAEDGISGYEMARSLLPDLMIVDWQMPVIDGPQLIRMIRSPEEILVRDIPIIMLTAHSDTSRVIESARVGANEFVRKPVSIKTLRDRIVSIIADPRPMVQIGEYYGPMPRRVAPVDIYATD
jgi:two-component system chemotaxis response regulator CheY